jgi:tetratricopeptide (TPR) repeat protein
MLSALSSTHPDPAQYSFELATLAYRSGEFSDCNARLAELEKTVAPNGRLEGLAGRCAAGSKQYEAAEEHLERAVQLDPEDLSNYNVLIEFELHENHLNSAMKLASQAAIRFPKHLEVWMWKGSTELESGHYHEAIESYRHAMSDQAANSEALLGLANAQLLSGDPSEVYKTYEQGIRQFPAEARFLVGFANALMQSPESAHRDVADRAQASLKKAIQLDGSSPAAHYLLGQSFLDQGRLTDSLGELQTAEMKDPDNASIHFVLERVFRRLGRTDEARKEFVLFEQTKGTRDNDPL